MQLVSGKVGFNALQASLHAVAQLLRSQPIQGGPEKKTRNGILPTICRCNNWDLCMR